VFSLKRYKRVRVMTIVIMAFVTMAIVAAALAVPKVKNYSVYGDRYPIRIEGDSEFTDKNGITGGIGTESDPYVIEGWGISCKDAPGILLADTSAHVLIRNVSIDGSGGYPYRYDGLLLQNASNVVIEKVIVRNAWYGILVEKNGASRSNSVSISDCVVQICRSDIYLGGLDNGSVEGCNVKDTNGVGIVVENCTSIALKNNLIDPRYGDWYNYEPSTTGIIVQDSVNIAMEDNALVYSYTYYGKGMSPEFLRCENVTVTRNSFDSGGTITVSGCLNVSFNNNTLRGLTLIDSHLCEIADNDIRGYYSYSYSLGAGSYSYISAYTSSKIRIVRNTADWLSGIAMTNVWDSVIQGNLLTNCTVGASVSGSNITIEDNLFAFSSLGLSITGDHITAIGNVLFDVYYSPLESYYPPYYYSGVRGVSVYNTDWANFSENLITSTSSSHAVVVSTSHNIYFTNNSIAGSIQIMETNPLNISNNVIGWNANVDFIGSFLSVVDFVHNTMLNISVTNSSSGLMISWSEGYPYGGNYWSQYAGVDEKSGPNQDQPGADGIGDSPYDLSPSLTPDIDEYPLIAPVGVTDERPPMTTLSVNGNNGREGWFISDVNLTISAYDNNAGVASTSYRLDDGPWTNYTSRIFITGEGVHVLDFFSADAAGNVEQVRSRTIKIDTEKPQPVPDMELEYRFATTDGATLYLEFEDNTSGISEYALSLASSYSYRYSWASNPSMPYFAVGFKNGTYLYYGGAYDQAGQSAWVHIWLNSSLNEDREPTSTSGPYGPWFDIVIGLDFALFFTVLWLSQIIVWGPIPGPGRGPGKEPGEVDKEDIVDGYPKYMKKM
jgi:parallel beta-helix repeat protein